MSDPKQLAKAAREHLAQALSALQSATDIPEELEDTADLIAEAMSAFHKIERGNTLEGRSDAYRKVRRALDRFLDWPLPLPVLPSLVEASASALAKAYALAKWSGEQAVRAELTPPPPAIAPAPIVPAPIVPVAPAPIAPAPIVPVAPAPIVPAPIVPVAPAPIAPAPVLPVAPAPIAPAPVLPVAPAPIAPKPVPITPVPVPVPAPAPAPVAAPKPLLSPVIELPPAPAKQPAPAPAPAKQPAPTPAPAPTKTEVPAQKPAAPAPAKPEPQKPAPSKASPEKRETLPAPPAGTPTFEVELTASSASNFYRGLLGNDVIENGGIFVATYKIPKIGTLLSLRVGLPGGFSFEAHAIVQWTRAMGNALDSADPGFGARITQVTQEGRHLIERYTRNREPIFFDDL